MFACVCWTPFQIINALNYKCNYAKDEKWDLYICNIFFNAEEIFKLLSKFKIAEKIYLVSDISYTDIPLFRRKVSILCDLLFPVKALNRAFDEKIPSVGNYDYILSSGFLNFNVIFNTYIVKKNKGESKILFMDDGIETYLSHNTKDKYSYFYKLISKVKRIGGAAMNVEAAYVYAPDLIQKKYAHLHALPKLDSQQKELKLICNKIFSFNTKNKLDKRIVYFDQIGTGDFGDEKEIQKQKKILASLIKIQGLKNKLEIKLHPRCKNKFIYDGYSIFSSNAPWELFCWNSDMSECILIGISSTACITPKLIFGQEPTVILLYRLFALPVSKDLEALFLQIQNVYTEKKRFLIPNDFEEFLCIMQQITKNENKL